MSLPGLPVNKQANVTLDQFMCIASFDRVMAALQMESAVLKQLGKHDVVAKLETAARHMEKARNEYIQDTQRSVVLAQVGAIPDISGKTH